MINDDAASPSIPESEPSTEPTQHMDQAVPESEQPEQPAEQAEQAVEVAEEKSQAKAT